MDEIHHHKEKPNIYAVIALLVVAALAIIFTSLKTPVGDEIFEGKVIEVRSERWTDSLGGKVKEQELLVELIVNQEKKEVEIINDFNPVEAGSKIFLRGGDDSFDIVDIKRQKGIIFLAALFIALVLAVSGLKGFYSLLGLFFSFAVIFSFIMPQILDGSNPIVISLIGSVFILLATLYLSYGFSKKSIAALIGISLTLLFVGIFASVTVGALRFSGFSGEEAMFLNMENSASLNLVGLLVAGIIIAAIGVLDDVAVTQASTVFSLSSVNENLRGFQLFRKAMEVGKDHISAVVNTLVLAYTGAALPLILLLSIRGVPFDYFVSIEVVAEEIVRTLIASAGLMLAVPLTTFVATMFVKKRATIKNIQ